MSNGTIQLTDEERESGQEISVLWACECSFAEQLPGCTSTSSHYLRPRPTSTYFTGCLELLVAIPGRLLVVGDFNIHVDNLGNSFSCKFISLIESFEIVRHVLDPTHIASHTLDLVLTRREEHFLADCFVADQLSDHSAVHWILKANRPFRPRKLVTLRRLKTVDHGLLLSDLLDLPFVAAPADEVDTLLQQYNSGVTDVLDVHAPTIMKTYTVCPDNPWMTEEILTARRNVRRIERRKRSTGLMIDKELLVTALSDLRQLISAAKVTFLNTKIADNTEKKSLLKNVDSFLLKKPGFRLPAHNSPEELVETFNHFFIKKI
ncbi:hypothetical protein DAPPUDRAFT_320379 [Daphnia pulex]|uniref:Endonuclease/exonuclease/phosphatase domain-containing protein n=1 Tax=Daphnia pulex TaxID=6669 RepID=E9GPP4_DAPPU|nr:hypothetical protein DAPPUDRAFT_320379 [Daphnia pulex]|eukprot:EFX78554.1 hypothetical protein DAPPUDRAFT_320379 [Daphnia pulex]